MIFVHAEAMVSDTDKRKCTEFMSLGMSDRIPDNILLQTILSERGT